MNDTIALLSVLPDVSSDRTKRFARAVASRYQPSDGGKGMGLVLPPLVIAPPAWSPDAVTPAPPMATVGNPFAGFVPSSSSSQAPVPASTNSSWWPPSKNVLAVGGGLLGLALLGWAIFRRRGAAPAPAPIVVVSSPAAAPAAAVKTNRPRFVKKKVR